VITGAASRIGKDIANEAQMEAGGATLKIEQRVHHLCPS
jgi:hypothetical protein